MNAAFVTLFFEIFKKILSNTVFITLIAQNIWDNLFGTQLFSEYSFVKKIDVR